MAISFTQLKTLFGELSQNTSAANLTFGGKIMNSEHRYLLQKYFNNEGSFSMPTVAQQQFYNLPPNYSKLKTVTITQGSLKWTPVEVLTREEWDQLNVFPYYSDIPNNFFIYGNQIGIWPIPSSSGNPIMFNYKFRVPDLSLEDVTSGTVAVNNSSATVTGTATAFVPTSNVQSESRWLQIAQPKGDNLWYQIASISSATSLALFDPYQGINVTGGTFTVGQMPLLLEDFHDMLVYKALTIYFSSKVDKKDKVAEYAALYNSKLELLNEYSGQKTVHVNLGRQPDRMNPNLFQQNLN